MRLEGITYEFVRKQQQINTKQKSSPQCMSEHYRYQEMIFGVPILGADMVITTNGCSNDENEISTLVTGYTYSDVNVNGGYSTKYSEEEAKLAVTTFAGGTDRVVIEFSDVILEVRPTTGGDFLVYSMSAVVLGDSGIQIIDVSINAHDLTEVISKCFKTGSPEQRRSSSLRKSSWNELKNELENRSIDAVDEFSTWGCSWESDTCEMRTLYLDNTGLEAPCQKCTKRNGDETKYFGEVKVMHYTGTQDCTGRLLRCPLAKQPDENNASADVHYGTIRTLDYFQNELGLLGIASDGIPVSVYSRAHVLHNLCNAFWDGRRLNFGDCDGYSWTAMVSMDTVAHELMHGVTENSSNLIYNGQSGGLNEGYSDIAGSVLEFYVNNPGDDPDFLVGEQLGGSRGILRDMENPPADGRGSIDSICDYSDNIDVHYSSGILNKAFVKSVRALESSSGKSERSCALIMGEIFLRSNIYMLTQSSKFTDAANAALRTIFENHSDFPKNELYDAIVSGWNEVDIDAENGSILCNFGLIESVSES
eukprot:CAMPEP_0194357610 /NCGR_PEP_ID=MMETSP0174-20130528/5069_1 /TAXON_ID=216777 /ORGANISM="Proboscia alata, Strain PI-D3" /LENGTH=534 /DNA_ID=CAMNT_0039127709 /DNA_START=248 /DNA_END=1852 /DNA_ORIENTATION=+